MSKIRKHISEKDFQRYLKNQMTDAERNAFERKLQNYPFEAEALEGFQKISPDELSQDLQELKAKIVAKKPKSQYRYWAVAATLLLLISTGIIWFQLKDKNPLPEMTETKTVDRQGKGKAEAQAQEQEQEQAEAEAEAKAQAKDQAGEEEKAKSSPVTGFRSDTSKKKPVTNDNPAESKSVKIVESKHAEKVAVVAKSSDAVSENTIQVPAADLKMDTSKQDITRQENDNRIMIRGVSTLAASQKASDSAITTLSDNFAGNNSNVIKGKVISQSDNQPLPGAVIQQKGTKNGTLADINGNFALPLKDDTNKSIVVSFVGMESQEFDAKKDSVKVIELESSQLALDEVVVTERPVSRKRQALGYAATAKPLTDSPALPVGGMEELEKYLEDNALLDENYPSKRVVVKVIIHLNSDGEITKIENSNNADTEVFEKAKQIISNGPEWTPEFKNGENIESKTELKIIFRKAK